MNIITIPARRPNVSMFSRVVRICATLLLANFCDTHLNAAVPAAAQEAFKKGMSAVQLQDFSLAIRYFSEARGTAPYSTEVLFNLALAEAQVPGRELRAICWFEAYLALSPGVANADAVRQQISDLEIRVEGNVRKTIDVMKILAGKFPSGDSSGTSAVVQIARTLAKSGDLDGAIVTVESLPSDDRDSARKSVVDVLAGMGRFDDAKKLTGSIGYDAQYKTTRSDAYMSIAQAQMSSGLYADARQSIGNMSNSYQRARLLGQLADGFFQTGSQDEAANIVAEIKQLADKLDKNSNLQYALQYLAAAQAGLGQQQEALATLKRMDALVPAKASDSNNSSIHDAVGAHLSAFDQAGARALIPRLIDVPGFKYKSDAIDKVNRAANQSVANQFQKIQKLSQSWDLTGMETMLAEPSMIPVVRIWGLAALADLYRQQAQSDPLRGIFEKAAAAFPGVGDIPVSKASAANWIANIAAAADMPAEVQTWRVRALQPVDALIKTGQQSVDGDLSSMFGYYQYAGVAQAIISAAISSRDEKTFQAGVDIVKKNLPKLDAATQASLAGAVLWRYWWVDKNFDTAAGFIKNIPDAKLRQQALDKQRNLQFSKLLAMGNLSEASPMLEQISDAPAGPAPFQKSDKPTLQRALSEAFADAGDWGNAEKIAAGISDVDKRKGALAHLAAARSEGGQKGQQSTEQDAASWREKRSALSSLPQSKERLDAFWQLCGYAKEGLLDEQRALVPEFFAAAMAASPKPDDRLGALYYAGLAARNLGLFELERNVRASAFSALQAGASPNWSAAGDFLNRASLADYIEQASIRWHDEILIKAIDRLVADGNPAAALGFAGKLTQTDESARNRILMNIRIAQGDLAEARTNYDKIGKDESRNGSAKSSATQEIVRAYIKAGDLAAAKASFEQSSKLRDNESTGSTIIKEIGVAGELEWAREKAKWIRYAPTRHEVEGAIVGTIAAHNQDVDAAKAVLRSMLEDGNSYYQYKLIDAVITAGNPQMALQLIPELSEPDAQASQTAAAVTALARLGDPVAAKKAAMSMGNNARRFSVRCQIGCEQAKKGDIEGATATLVEARKLDLRTSKELDVNAWVNEQISYALKENGDFAGAQANAVKIQDPIPRDSRLSAIVYAAVQKKNFPAVQSALSAIDNPEIRSKAASSAVSGTTDVAQILALIDQMNDPGFQALALSRALNTGISLGNISTILPRVLALPDGAVKVRLLCDVLRARAFVGLDIGNAALLPVALKALAAMPPDVWHTLLLRDLSGLAQQMGAGQAAILQKHAETEAGGLSGEDAATWKQFLSDAEATALEAQKPSGPGGSSDSPAKAWEDYVESNLNKPLFTDFKLALDGAASSTSDNTNKAWGVFNNVERLADDLLDNLKKIRELGAKQSKAPKS